MATTPVPTVTTDLLDYAPGSTAVLTASNFIIGSTLEFQVLHVTDPGSDGLYGTLDDVLGDNSGEGHEAWYVTDGVRTAGADGVVGTADDEGDLDGVADGNVVTNWYVNPDDSLGATFLLTASGFGADVVSGTDDDQVAATSFTDGGNDFSITARAADPADYPSRLSTDPLINPYPTGSGTTPAALNLAEFGDAPGDSVSSLAPGGLGLGQVVVFEFLVAADDKNPKNGVEDSITFKYFWDVTTTNGSAFGYDDTKGVIAAFVDTSDDGKANLDGNESVSVTWAIGTGGRIEGTFIVSGLNDQDKVVIEAWLVLDSTVPAGAGGNVQSGMISAQTSTGDTINVGQNTTPLNQVGAFFTAQADLSVIKSDEPADVALPSGVSASPDPDPVGVQPGSTFTYTIVAKNNSSDIVSNGVVVTDTLDANVSFVSASDSGVWAANGANPDTVTWNLGFLNPGETKTLTVTVNVPTTAPFGGTQDLLNSVSITSITQDSNQANNTNTEPTDLGPPVPPQGSLDVEKYVFVTGAADEGAGLGWVAADSITGPVFLSGFGNPDFKYVIENTAIFNATVTLTDNVFALNGLTGDLDLIEAGYQLIVLAGTSSELVFDSAAWTAGQHTNTASVEGFYLDSGDPTLPFTDSDDANYFGATAGVTILKEVSVDGGTTWLPANDPDGPSVLVGEDVKFRVKVTNNTNGALALDDANITDNTGLDFVFGGSQTVDIAAGQTATSDVITITALAGNHENTATVNGTVSDGTNSTPVTDDDDANYFGATAGVTILKEVSVDGGTTWLPANDPDGPSVLVGEDVKFRVKVTNNTNGALALDDANITDNTGLDFVFGGSQTVDIAAGQTATSDVITITALAGNHENTATVNGTVSDGTNSTPVTDDDDANYFGATAGVTILKEVSVDGGTTWLPANDPDGPSVLVGEDVKFRVKVTNNTNGALALDDANITDNTGLDFVFGGSQTVDIAAGQTATSDVITITALAGNHENTATVNGTVSDGTNSTPVTDDDDANYFGATAGVTILKEVSVDGGTTWLPANDPDGPSVLVGEDVKFRVKVTNNTNGALALDDANITDNTGLDFVFGGSQTVDIAAGQTATSDVITITALAGNHENTATVNGTVSDGTNSTPVTDDDDANYFGATAGVTILKEVSVDGGTTWLPANDPDGPSVLVGEDVKFRVKVTNNTNGALALDDANITDNTGLDFVFGGSQTVDIAAGQTATSDVITITALAGNHENTATVNGTVSDGTNSTPVTDDDDANYFGATAGVTILKEVSVDGGTTWLPANDPDGPSVLVGEDVKFRVKVTNNTNGALALDDANITDNTGLDFVFGGSQTVDIAAGQTATSDVITITALAGNHENTATVNGTVSDGTNSTPVTDDDDANYFGATAGVTILKEVSVDGGTTWLPANDPDGPSVLVGEDVKFRVKVTNNTNGALALDDANITDNTGLDFVFGGSQTVDIAAGQTATSDVITITALAGNHENTATVNGTVSDGTNSTPVTDDDDANYFGATAGVTILKEVSVDGGTTWLPANDPDGPSVLVGEDVKFRVKVTNNTNGALALDDANITDNTGLDFVFGGSQTVDIAAGQTATSDVITITALAGNHENTATVNGTVSDGTNSTPVTDDDDANYFGATAGVTILKEVSVDGGTTWLPANDPDGPSVLVGEDVKFRVKVTNNTNGALALDDANITDNTGLDFVFGGSQTVDIAAGQTATSDVITITALAGNHENTATVNGTVSDGTNSTPVTDDDDANYFGATAGVTILKEVSVDGGTTWLPANDPDGPSVLVGEDVKFRVKVTNNTNGALALDDANITDNTGLDFVFGGSQTVDIAAGQTATSDVITITALAGNHENTATVNGTVSDGTNSTPVTDDDDANYFGATAGVTILKEVSVDGGTTWLPANDPDGPSVLVGEDVKFRVKVTNNTNGALALDDANITDNTGLDFVFGGSQTVDIAAGQTATSDVITITALAGNHENTATVNGTVSDGTNSTPVTDDDDANYFGANPELVILKSLTNDNDAIVDMANETIEYTITVDNTGNVDLTGVVLDDVFSGGATYMSGDDTNVGVLDTDEIWTYSASYTVTQADLNAGDDLVNVAGVTTDQTARQIDDAVSEVDQIIPPQGLIDLEKFVSVDGGVTWDPADSLSGPVMIQGTGDPEFRFVLENISNVTATNVVLSDSNFSLDQLVGNGGAVVDLDPGNTTFTIGSLGPNESVEIFFTAATWQAGQHTNTATVNYTFDGAPFSASDDANYFGELAITGPGVRTPGFWTNTKWQDFWDGDASVPKQAADANFPDADVVLAPVGADPGYVMPMKNGEAAILIGDFDLNGLADGADTILLSKTEALQILSANAKVSQDTQFVLGRDLVATWLNYLAGNPIDGPDSNPGIAGVQDPHSYIDEAIDWLKWTTGGSGNPLDPSTTPASNPAWNTGIDANGGGFNQNDAGDILAGNLIHSKLDEYNNNGSIDPDGPLGPLPPVVYALDGDLLV